MTITSCSVFLAKKRAFTTASLFESGVLSAEAAILQLKAYKTYDQLSFHTARAIGALRFVKVYVRSNLKRQ